MHVTRFQTLKGKDGEALGPCLKIRNTFEKITTTFSPKLTFVEFVTFIANNFGFFFGISVFFCLKNTKENWDYFFAKKTPPLIPIHRTPHLDGRHSSYKLWFYKSSY